MLIYFHHFSIFEIDIQHIRVYAANSRTVPQIVFPMVRFFCIMSFPIFLTLDT